MRKHKVHLYSSSFLHDLQRINSLKHYVTSSIDDVTKRSQTFKEIPGHGQLHSWHTTRTTLRSSLPISYKSRRTNDVNVAVDHREQVGILRSILMMGGGVILPFGPPLYNPWYYLTYARSRLNLTLNISLG